MVTICRELFSLMRSTMAANVVDFPEPVGPVTSTRPASRSARSPTTLDSPSCSSVSISSGIRRKTAAAPCSCSK